MTSFDVIPEKYRDATTEVLKLDPNWVWVLVDHDHRIIGFLIGCACHGVAFALRVRIDEESPRIAFLILLRQFFRDCRARGLDGWFSFLDAKIPTELGLIHMMTRAFKGTAISGAFTCIATPFPEDS